MMVIEPIEPVLVSTTVPENEWPVWVAGSYAPGARVIKDHYIYESLADGNTSTPGESTTWSEVSATNRQMCIDSYLYTQSTADTTMTTVFEAGRCSHLALFGLTGHSLTWSYYDYEGNEPQIVKSETVSLRQDTIASFTEFFFSPISYRSDLLIPLPLRYQGRIELTLNSSDTVGLGHVCLGRSIEIGTTEWKPKIGIQPYSRRTVNDWGYTKFIPGESAKTVELSIVLPSAQVSYVQKKLMGLEGVPTAFSGNNDGTQYESLLVYGAFEDSSLVLETKRRSHLSLDIAGLI